jgi:hypothetical protein
MTALACGAVSGAVGGLPARGFFLKAAKLGFDVSDPIGFATSHRAGLFSRRA